MAYQQGGTTTRTDYARNKVYNNGTLGMILTGEGYITLSGSGTPTYHYYLKDHQGNNRVVMDQAGTVLQVNHYYPFGGLFGEGVQDRNQRYKYNGKELDRTMNLDLYDYGARHYDAATGRWLEPDLLAEKYYFESPYVYVHNSPIIHIDPDGRDGLIIISGNSVIIKSNIILTGNAATTQLANIYKQDIMDNWGLMKTYTHSGNKYNITWDVNVRVAFPNEEKVFNGMNNYLEVRPEIQSNIKNTNTGEIRSTNLEFFNPMSHEFGHILGLRDKYVTDKESSKYGKPISEYWKDNIMAAEAGLGVVEDKNMKILLEKPLRMHKQRQLLRPDNAGANSIFKTDPFDFFKETNYWINKKNREQ